MRAAREAQERDYEFVERWFFLHNAHIDECEQKEKLMSEAGAVAGSNFICDSLVFVSLIVVLFRP